MKQLGVVLISIIVILIIWCLIMRFHVIDKFTNNDAHGGYYIQDIATGANHTIFLTNKKDIYVCGFNDNGRLGTGDATTHIVPKKIDGIKCIDKVFAGHQNSFFLSLTEAYACGNNNNSQLGTNDSASFNKTPMSIQTEGIIDIVPGREHTFFLDSCNNVYVVGSNMSGQLGLGNNIPSTTIQKMPTILKIEHLSSGYEHALFLIKGNNQVYACGSNLFGQLGIGNNEDKQSLTLVRFPTGVKIIKVVAGLNHSFFITDTHTVYACGNNKMGQLGTGNTTNYSSPTLLTDLKEPIVDIVSNYEHTVFISKSGNIYACGRNGNGQLGLGDTMSRNKPTKVSSLTIPVKKVCTGDAHTIYLLTNGKVYASGRNSYGNLGTGDTAQYRFPELCSITFPTGTTQKTLHSKINGSPEVTLVDIESQQCSDSPPILDCDSHNLLVGSLIRRRFVLNSQNRPDGASRSTVNFDNSFNNITSTETIHVTNFNIPNDNFIAFEYTGWLVVSTSGKYTFALSSDDGSDFAVFLNDTWSIITNAYGYKPPERFPPKPGEIDLIGDVLYPIRIRFHEQGGGQALNVFWIPPNETSYSRVPFSIFRSQQSAIVLSEGFPNPAGVSKIQSTLSSKGISATRAGWYNVGRRNTERRNAARAARVARQNAARAAARQNEARAAAARQATQRNQTYAERVDSFISSKPREFFAKALDDPTPNANLDVWRRSSPKIVNTIGDSGEVLRMIGHRIKKQPWSLRPLIAHLPEFKAML